MRKRIAILLATMTLAGGVAPAASAEFWGTSDPVSAPSGYWGTSDPEGYWGTVSPEEYWGT